MQEREPATAGAAWAGSIRLKPSGGCARVVRRHARETISNRSIAARARRREPDKYSGDRGFLINNGGRP